ncbi:MAG: sulfurtransferase, partial [Bacteroidetes bacterium]|nr:sulfurtransferase [Bacteroidota bacterium]
MKPFRTLLYYKYVHIPDAAAFTQQHMEWCQQLGLVGRIIVADEVMNGTGSGTVVAVHKYMDALNNHP